MEYKDPRLERRSIAMVSLQPEKGCRRAPSYRVGLSPLMSLSRERSQPGNEIARGVATLSVPSTGAFENH
jgi:hypothetical protein